MILKGRSIFPGSAKAITLVTHMGISFYGGVNPETGIGQVSSMPIVKRSPPLAASSPRYPA